MKKILKSEEGISLLELLAASLISIVVVLVGYNLLMTGVKTAERVHIETQLRDEADYIMGNIIETFYLTKTSEIVKEEFNASQGRYLLHLKDNKLIGFKENKLHILKDDQQDTLEIINSKIEIDSENTQINKLDDSRYEIELHLKSGKHSLTTTSAINLIDDI